MTLDTALRRRISEALDREGGLDADTELNNILASNPDAQAYAGELLALESQLRDWPLPERSDAEWEAFAASIESRLDEPLAAIDDPTLPPETSFEADAPANVAVSSSPVAMLAAPEVRASATVTNLASRRPAARNKWFGYSALAASVLVASIAGISVFRSGSPMSAPSERDLAETAQSAPAAFEAPSPPSFDQLPAAAAPPAASPLPEPQAAARAEAVAEAPAADQGFALGGLRGGAGATGAGRMRLSDDFDDAPPSGPAPREQRLGNVAAATAQAAAVGQAYPRASAEGAAVAPSVTPTATVARAASPRPTSVPTDGLATEEAEAAPSLAPSPAPASPARTRAERSSSVSDSDAVRTTSAAAPTSLSAPAARAVFVRLQPQVAACLRPSGTDAVGVSVDVLGATGAVTAARISGGAAGSSEGACVVRVLRAAVFPRFEAERATFTHTFVVATPEQMRRQQDSMESSF